MMLMISRIAAILPDIFMPLECQFLLKLHNFHISIGGVQCPVPDNILNPIITDQNQGR